METNCSELIEELQPTPAKPFEKESAKIRSCTEEKPTPVPLGHLYSVSSALLRKRHHKTRTIRFNDFEEHESIVKKSTAGCQPLHKSRINPSHLCNVPSPHASFLRSLGRIQDMGQGKTKTPPREPGPPPFSPITTLGSSATPCMKDPHRAVLRRLISISKQTAKLVASNPIRSPVEDAEFVLGWKALG